MKNIKSTLEKLQKENSRPFFLWKLHFSEVFKEKGGFDVVIANPPYVNVEKIDISIKKCINYFKTAYQKYDLYILFYEKSISLLKQNGILTFISSNKFLSQGYGFLLRQFFLNFKINIIINFNFNIFETATVRTCIFQLSKRQFINNIIKIIDVNNMSDKHKFLEEKYNYIAQNIFQNTEENNFRINLTTEKITLLGKIANNCLRVDNICSVNYGLRPSSEKLNRKKDYFIKDSDPKGLYKKYFEGKDMGYWRINKFSYLDYRPDVMYNPMFVELFQNNKLVGLRTLSDITKLRFIYDENGLLCNDSVVILSPWHLFNDVNYSTIKRNITQEKIDNSKKYSIKYLQAILNSRLTKFYVNELLYDGTHFYPDHMKQLPIKIAAAKQQKPFIEIVDKILAITDSGDYLENPAKQAKVKEYENQIDQLVYKLYELTPEEIKIVEEK
ncbi:MAG: TaqI-like C-terminal specificity domain-containing protein [Endomicrobiaceae bacterium]|nr:TaqI-like C-terminal specificity domain-containing protein [Endomicrobiaceae bacterium]